MKTIVIVITLICIASGCTQNERQAESGTAVGPREGQSTFQIFGALKKMFHEGQVDEQVSLASLLPNEDLYAVGALSQLRGEITVVGGQVYLSYAEEDDEIRNELSGDSAEGAALLVAGCITEWKTGKVDRDIEFAELDDRIAGAAERCGIDVSKPFFFHVKGPVRQLKIHVIDGRRLSGGGGSHEDHLNAAVKREFESCDAFLVGFFSRSHQQIVTHMASNTHIHAVIETPLLSGHVDRVVIPSGTAIQFANVIPK